MRRRAFALIGFMLALAPWHQLVQADAAHYTVETLPKIDGRNPTITGINESGQMSGYVEGAAGPRAVRYSNGSWSYLAGLDSVSSFAYGINAAGDVAGYRATPAGQRAYRYRDGFGVEDIAPLAGGTFTRGFAINNAGVVVGFGNSSAGLVAFSAAPGAAATALPGLGGFLTQACGINDAGQITGSGFTADSLQHAFRLDPGASAPVDLESFNGAGGQSAGCAIDADGRVGGQADSPAGAHAFRFGPPLLDLDTFGSSGSNTASIAAGTSVGFFTLGTGTRAFVHTDADGTLDLNSLMDNGAGWVLTSAKAVNATGTIVGEGTFNGAPVLFRLTKVNTTPPDTVGPTISNFTASPAVITRPDGTMVPVTLSYAVTDDVDPSPVCALPSITSTGSTADDYVVTGPNSASVRAVGGQTYTITVTCTDTSGNPSSAATSVTVLRDTTAPVITALSATPAFIWPPNGKMMPVSVSVSATDDVDASPVCVLHSITGAAASDFAITGQFTANVRAEKDYTYTLNVKCSDGAGNRSFGSVAVTVSNKDSQIVKALAKK
jgi:hypothetical protein